MKRHNSNLSDATVNEKLSEIENKINGKFSANLAKITGNKVEDIIELASEPDQLRKAWNKQEQLLSEGEDIQDRNPLKFDKKAHGG